MSVSWVSLVIRMRDEIHSIVALALLGAATFPGWLYAVLAPRRRAWAT